MLCKVSSIIMTVAIDAHYLPLVDFYALAPLASCSGRSVRLCFVLCNVGSIIMTVAINALYLPFVDFYALALLASRFFCVYCLAMLAHQIMTNPSCNFLSSDWTFVRVAQKKHPCYSIRGWRCDTGAGRMTPYRESEA